MTCSIAQTLSFLAMNRCQLCVQLTIGILLLTQKALGIEYVLRTTNSGRIRGYLHVVENQMAEAYLSVPYAAPPVGDNRLELPVKMAGWTDIRNATEPPPWCTQFWFSDPRLENREQSEDCLFLNILLPHKTVYMGQKVRKPFPVMVWIHGGSYQVNGANMFPINGTVRNLVSKGIAIVFVNYRLGPLGFLSLLNSGLPGNYGLEDQIFALNWIHENGANFDLDLNRITVGGESAGAGSASILAVSPRSKHLFHGLVLRSGSSLAPWAVRTMNTNLNSELMIKALGCGNKISDLKNTKDCLKKSNIKEWVNEWRSLGLSDIHFVQSKAKQPPVHYNHPFLAHTYFTPVLDHARGNMSIIPEYPNVMVRKHSRMPMLIGVTSGECLAYVMWLYFVSSMTEWGVDLTNLEYVVPQVIYKNREQVKEAVFDHYLRRDNHNDLNFGRTLVEIASDQNFVTAAVEEARMYANNNQIVYAYQFDHNNEYMDKKHEEYRLINVGSAHGYDMVFLFQNTSVIDPAGLSLNWTQADLKVTQILSQSIASFVSHGEAKVSGKSWPQYKVDCGQSMVISSKLRLGDFFSDVHDFWKKVVPVIDSLTLTVGYEYHPVLCVENCPNSAFYRAAFFVALVLILLLVLALILSFCARQKNSFDMVESYRVPLNTDN